MFKAIETHQENSRYVHIALINPLVVIEALVYNSKALQSQKYFPATEKHSRHINEWEGKILKKKSYS